MEIESGVVEIGSEGSSDGGDGRGPVGGADTGTMDGTEEILSREKRSGCIPILLVDLKDVALRTCHGIIDFLDWGRRSQLSAALGM